MSNKGPLHAAAAVVLAVSAAACLAAEPPAAAPAKPQAAPPQVFLRWGFENASPLQWEAGADGVIHVHMLYDYERNSPNRAAGHWHFQLQGKPGSDVTLVLDHFDNIYKLKPGGAVSKKTVGCISPDDRHWKPLPGEFLEGNRLRLRVHLDGDSVYIARAEPYRLSDLDRLLDEIRGRPLVEITPIGKTVEGRPLEIVRVGEPDAPFRVLLRARAHAWEPAGNWVVQGLVRALLEDDELSRKCLKRYCVYVMPMANKDAVARGLTRFNMQGRDLNRNWDQPTDPLLAPECHALETWLQGMIRQGRPIALAMDFHNDEGGGLEIARPPIPDLQRHLDRMRLLEQVLQKHTWFTEGSSGPKHRTPGSIGEGLLERYGIDACILEFNANWIAGLKQPASGAAWEQFGRQLRGVFWEYFGEIGPTPGGDSKLKP
jgi:hypothetical protein